MNKVMLREEMRKRSITVVQITRELGISRSAFWKKCNGKSEFKLGEIKKITEILNTEKANEIFFS